MKEGFRQAMAWLHTWTGLIFGWLLFAIFLTGTMSYFKEEINHWAQPEVPVRPHDPLANLTLAQSYLQVLMGAGVLPSRESLSCPTSSIRLACCCGSPPPSRAG